VAANLTKIEGK